MLLVLQSFCYDYFKFLSLKWKILGHGGTSLYSSVYHLLPVDLREKPSLTLTNLLCSSENPTGKPVMDHQLPTLLIFECVLAYMQPSASSALLSWFAETFQNKAPLGILVYEMFGLNDSFGQVMKANLKVSPLPVSSPSKF